MKWQFWDQFGAKIMSSYNSGTTLRIFLKFSKIKETKRYMKVEKKKKFGASEPFWAQKLRILMTLDPFQGVFKDFAQ